MTQGHQTGLCVQRSDLIAPDLLPTCPTCLMLCDPGSLYCCEDGTRLTLSVGEARALGLQFTDARVGNRHDSQLDTRSFSPVRGVAGVTRRRGIGGI